MKVEDTNGWPNRLLLATMLPSSWLLLLALRLGLCLVLFRREATRAAALVMSSGWHAWLSFLTHSYYQCLVGDFFFFLQLSDYQSYWMDQTDLFIQALEN